MKEIGRRKSRLVTSRVLTRQSNVGKLEKTRRGGEEQKEEKAGKRKGRFGHVEGVDTASSVTRVAKGSGGGETQKEEKAGKTNGRLVTSKALTLQAV